MQFLFFPWPFSFHNFKTLLSIINISTLFFFFKDLQMMVYKVNNTFGNPYDVWKKMGKPDFPTKEQFQEIRKQEVSQ